MDYISKLKRNKILSFIEKHFFMLSTCISPVLNTKLRYMEIFRKKLDLNNPKTLNEKILWLKLNKYMNDPLVIQCADKVKVRNYIKECGCEEILIDLIRIYDKPEDIVWDELPNQFALKWNFGAGMNLICIDKSKLRQNDVLSQFKKWGKNKYWLTHSEMQYKYIDKKIICERLLVSDTEKEDGESISKTWIAPKDYKVYCFNGQAKYVMVCVGREKGKHPLFFYYDKDWELQPFSKDALSNPDYDLKKPSCLNKLFEYAEILSKPFPFVRADFYCLKDKIYFGELTFTPSAGLDASRLKEVDLLFGSMVDLNYKY